MLDNFLKMVINVSMHQHKQSYPGCSKHSNLGGGVPHNFQMKCLAKIFTSKYANPLSIRGLEQQSKARLLHGNSQVNRLKCANWDTVVASDVLDFFLSRHYPQS